MYTCTLYKRNITGTLKMYILYLTKYSNSNRLYTKSVICVYRNHLTSLPNIFIIKHKPADTCECAKMLVSHH